MGNLNCTQSGRLSIPISEAATHNNQTESTFGGNTVARNEILNFLTNSNESLSSNSDIAIDPQTLPSRIAVLVNTINTIQQESIQNPSLYSKLVAQLPDNPDFYPEKFIDNGSCDPRQYLKNNRKQLVKALSDAISKDTDLSVSSIDIDANFGVNSVLFLTGHYIELCQNKTYDPKTGEVVDELSKRFHPVAQEFNLSGVIENSKNLAEFITNMRLAATFADLNVKINAPANGFDIGIISPFTGSWKEDVYANKEESLENYFTPDMEYFSFSEILSTVQEALFKEMDEWEDVPDSFGGYSSKADSIKMYYV